MCTLQPLWSSHLFSRIVWTLSRPPVVLGSVEGHERVALALLVVHLVAFFDRNPVKLDGAAVLSRVQDLLTHNLTWKNRVPQG